MRGMLAKTERGGEGKLTLAVLPPDFHIQRVVGM